MLFAELAPIFVFYPLCIFNFHVMLCRRTYFFLFLLFPKIRYLRHVLSSKNVHVVPQLTIIMYIVSFLNQMNLDTLLHQTLFCIFIFTCLSLLTNNILFYIVLSLISK